MGILLSRHTIMLLRYWLKFKGKLGRKLSRNNSQIYLRDRVAEYKSIWVALSKQLNAEFSSLDSDLWQLVIGDKKVRVRLHELPLDNNVVLKICGRKSIVHNLIEQAGIPVPKFERFTLSSLDLVSNFLNRFPKGVVVKPHDGYSGLGVSTHIKTKRSLIWAIAAASQYSDSFLIENQIPGESFRLLVFKGKLLSAVRRTGNSVTGDGRKAVFELMKVKNLDCDTTRNADLDFALSSKNVQFNTIPERGSRVLVGFVGSSFNGGSELRTVYDADVTEAVHDSIKDDVAECARIVEGNLLGIDIITTDITKNLRDVGGVVAEINTTPAFHHHYDSDVESYPQLTKTILCDLFGMEVEHVPS